MKLLSPTVALKVVPAFVFLASLITLCSTQTSFSQNKTLAVKDTNWAWVQALDYGTGTVQCYYRFELNQKVTGKCVAIEGSKLRLGLDMNELLFNASTVQKVNNLPPAVGITEFKGTYTQNGSSVEITFSDCTMSLKIKNSSLITAKVTYNNPNRMPREEVWEWQRISPDN